MMLQATERRDRPMATVKITHLTEPGELFRHYPGQTEPQPCVLVLDLEDGDLSADFNPRVGAGSTRDVHFGVKQWIPIPCLTAECANRLLEEVAPIAQRILDGATVDYHNGDKHGFLNDAAAAAFEELAERCEAENFTPQETVGEWPVADWFAEGDESTIDDLDITVDTTDEELAAKAAGEVESARTAGEAGYNLLDLDNTIAYLTGLRDGLREEVRTELDEIVEQADELEAKRDEKICQIRAWGDSFRHIGKRAGISHTEVKRIVDEAAADAQKKVDLQDLVRQAVIDAVTGFTVTLRRPSDWNAPSSDWNWSEAATDQWIEQAGGAGLFPQVVSTEVDNDDRQAAIVEVKGIHFVLEVREDDIRAVERDPLERYHVIEIDGTQFVTGYTDVAPDFRGLSLCFDGVEEEQPADLDAAARYISEKTGTPVRMVEDDRLSAASGQNCWVPAAIA